MLEAENLPIKGSAGNVANWCDLHHLCIIGSCFSKFMVAVNIDKHRELFNAAGKELF